MPWVPHRRVRGTEQWPHQHQCRWPVGVTSRHRAQGSAPSASKLQVGTVMTLAAAADVPLGTAECVGAMWREPMDSASVRFCQGGALQRHGTVAAQLLTVQHTGDSLPTGLVVCGAVAANVSPSAEFCALAARERWVCPTHTRPRNRHHAAHSPGPSVAVCAPKTDGCMLVTGQLTQGQNCQQATHTLLSSRSAENFWCFFSDAASLSGPPFPPNAPGSSCLLPT